LEQHNELTLDAERMQVRTSDNHMLSPTTSQKYTHTSGLHDQPLLRRDAGFTLAETNASLYAYKLPSFSHVNTHQIAIKAEVKAITEAPPVDYYVTGSQEAADQLEAHTAELENG
jgi:hypothetical protein